MKLFHLKDTRSACSVHAILIKSLVVCLLWQNFAHLQCTLDWINGISGTWDLSRTLTHLHLVCVNFEWRANWMFNAFHCDLLVSLHLNSRDKYYDRYAHAHTFSIKWSKILLSSKCAPYVFISLLVNAYNFRPR